MIESLLSGVSTLAECDSQLAQIPSSLEKCRRRCWLETESKTDTIETSTGNVLNESINSSELFLASVVKVYCTSTAPNFHMPWQMLSQTNCTSSGFVISTHPSKRWIMGNAHGATHPTNIRICKHGDVTKYVARVLHIGHECDLVLLTVDDEQFWIGLQELSFGYLPRLQETVVVAGYPTGGDNLSVTKGVVSRVTISTYSHSLEQLLTIQIDAAINMGNSGGPCIQGTHVVGVAFQGIAQSQNIGYIIPVPIIFHFLDDIDIHSCYTGFPRLAFDWTPMENKSIREYFAIPPNKHGILVNGIERACLISQVLRKNDVITSIDGIPLGDDGTIHFRRGERISFRSIEKSKFIDEEISLSVIRDNRELTITCSLDSNPTTVPYHLHDQLPQYIIYAGIVFTPLTRSYLKAYATSEWYRCAFAFGITNLIDYVLNRTLLKQEKDEQIIILSQILVDTINNGYTSSCHNKRLFKVNNVEIKTMKQMNEVLEGLLANDLVEYIRFELENDGLIVISKAEAKQANERILKQNNIVYEKSKDLI